MLSTQNPKEIIQHRWNVIPNYEKQREMNKIEQVINIEWNTSKADQKYLKTLQDTHHQLDTLKADPSTPKMIRKVICAIEKHAELEKAGERLEKKTEAQQ